MTTLLTYTIDAAMSRFTVRAFAGGFLSALGHNPVVAIRDFTGLAKFDPGAVEQASLEARIKTASLEVQNDMSDKDRREMEHGMHEEVLESARYPEIVFESTHIVASETGEGRFRATIDGNLTLHGETRSLRVPAQVIVTDGQLRAFGEFELRQTDYGIKLASALGGSLKLKDELKLTFDVLARSS